MLRGVSGNAPKKFMMDPRSIVRMIVQAWIHRYRETGPWSVCVCVCDCLCACVIPVKVHYVSNTQSLFNLNTDALAQHSLVSLQHTPLPVVNL